MFTTSMAVLVLGVGLGGIALIFLLWAFKSGQFDDLESWAMLVFEPDELRYVRPWETPEQSAERRRMHGEPIQPKKGEWGGAE